MQFFAPKAEVAWTLHRLSHWQQGEVPVFVTFRLADSLPSDILRQWIEDRDAFVAANPPPWDEETEREYHRLFSDRIEEQLDAAHGCCALRDPRVAEIVEERLRYFDGKRYTLWSFVIMPNHVHVLASIAAGESLPEIVKGWKGVSSRMIHREGLSDLNPFWQPDYFDRLIRSPEHFETTLDYIRHNPAKACLASGFVFWEAAP